MSKQNEPVPLPLGQAEFESWMQDIRKLLSPKVAEVPDDDIRFVLATSITHLGPKVDALPLEDFVTIIHAAAAKQVAGSVFQGVKIRQQEKQQAAAEAAKTEQTSGEETAKS